MTSKAEIFDKVQYLYEETKFNDHQLHCVLHFKGQLDASVLKKAVMELLHIAPILSSAYHHEGGNDYWEYIDPATRKPPLFIAYDETSFSHFTTSKTNEATGPQMQFCLYRSGTDDALSVIMNHMVCDGAGFKQLLYVVADLYSKLLDDPTYRGTIIQGDRSLLAVMQRIKTRRRMRALLLRNDESNKADSTRFPLDTESGKTFPFILTRKVEASRFARIRSYCKQHHVTVNDVVLAAYFRALCRTMSLAGRRTWSLPIMIDMRRYLKASDFGILSNLSSTSILHIPIRAEGSLEGSVSTIHRIMEKKKASDIGMNGFVKLNTVFRLLDNRTSYKLTKSSLHNPPICMTNIGILDKRKLTFKGTELIDAFECGSIKYRPHFQIAVSSFDNTMTLSSNLYGSEKDRATITRFLALVESLLP